MWIGPKWLHRRSVGGSSLPESRNDLIDEAILAKKISGKILSFAAFVQKEIVKVDLFKLVILGR